MYAIVEQRFDGCENCELCKPPAESKAGPTLVMDTPS
jgi:hypothetical protein